MEQRAPNLIQKGKPQACGCPGKRPKYICVNEACPNYYTKRFFCTGCLDNGFHEHGPYPRTQIGQN